MSEIITLSEMTQGPVSLEETSGPSTRRASFVGSEENDDRPLKNGVEGELLRAHVPLMI